MDWAAGKAGHGPDVDGGNRTAEACRREQRAALAAAGLTAAREHGERSGLFEDDAESCTRPTGGIERRGGSEHRDDAD